MSDTSRRGVPRMMIFVPLSRAQAGQLRESGRSDDQLLAFSSTSTMIAAHDYRPDEREDADYAAQLYASLAGLLTSSDDTRLVVAAEVPIARVSDGRSDSDYGAIAVAGLDWQDVTAVFVDEPAAAGAVGSARQAVALAANQSLETILELPEVVALTSEHELLWHTPDESW